MKLSALLPASLCQLVEELRGLEEVTKAPDRFFLDGVEHFLAFSAAFIDGIEGDSVVLKNLISEKMHPLREILVENKAKDVIAKVIGTHLSSAKVVIVVQA